VTHTPQNPGSRLSAPIDLRLVRQLFAAPNRVIESNFLRREVAGRMLERLALVKINPKRVLDAGCGEGADLSALHARFADAHMVGVDASPQMLGVSRANSGRTGSPIRRFLGKYLATVSAADLFCGDFAQLPFGVNALDLVWSNLALHWHPQPDRVFAEWRRVLRIDGLLMFSCFGPDTFKELRSAFSVVDAAPHSLPFVDMHDFGDMLVNAGFSTPVMDMENITVTYPTVEKLMADVRAWGGNPLLTRRRGLLGKAAFQRVTQALDQMRRPDGKIPLSFEIIYGHAFRPAPRLTAGGETIVRMDLRPPPAGVSGERKKGR
jgi:malonyl-CoA O-methyltransferase